MYTAAGPLEPEKGPFFAPPPFRIWQIRWINSFRVLLLVYLGLSYSNQGTEQLMPTKLQLTPLGFSNLSTALLLNRLGHSIITWTRKGWVT